MQSTNSIAILEPPGAPAIEPYGILRSDGSCNPDWAWFRWLSQLAALKTSIDDRSPAWFRDVPLRIVEPGNSPIDIRIENGPVNRTTLSALASVIATQLGVRLEFAADPGSLNRIDRIFHLRTRSCAPLVSERNVAYDTALSGEAILTAVLVQKRLRDVDLATAAAQVNDSLEVRTAMRQDGSKLRYLAGGRSGPAIVLVNAFGQSIDFWLPLLPALLNRGRLIVLQPGLEDRSGATPLRDATISAHAADLRTVVLAEHAAPCAFLGWCTGPKLILELAATHPELVSSLVFLSGSFKNVPALRAAETAYESGLDGLLGLVDAAPSLAGRLADSLKAFLVARAAEAPVTASESEAARILASPWKALESLVARPFASPAHVVSYSRQLREFWRHDSASALRSLQVPALFIGGDCDGIASPQLFRAAAESVPRAAFARVFGGSHYLQHEYPELVAGMIQAFLDRSDAYSFAHPLVEFAPPCPAPVHRS